MRKKTKITLRVFLALVGVVLFEILYGFYLMAVENRYGDLQEVYFLSENGDVIIDNNQRVGLIRIVATRVFVEEKGARMDLCDWVSSGRKQPVAFVVYRVDTPEAISLEPSFEEVVSLVEDRNV